jgi:type IV secretory pathway VirB3-like protein
VEYEYLIPENVKSRFEFFPGFGMMELFFTLIGAIFGAIIYFAISIFTQNPLALISIPIMAGGGYLISKPDPRTGMSLLSMIENFKQFKLRQKKYYYVFGSGRKYD